MAVTTVGKFLINEQLPDQLKGQFGELNKKGIQKLYQRIAQEFPERYRDVSLALQRLGGTAAYHSGGYSVGVSDLVKVPHEAQAVRVRLKNAVKQVIADPTLSPDEKNDKLIEVTKSFNEELENTLYKSSLAAKHPVAMQVSSGAKGSPGNLKSLLVGDGLYTDANYKEIPFPVLKSYSEGLTGSEFLASSFGSRLGVVLTKLCLLYDSQIMMADGMSKRICDVKVGDTVVGVDKTGKTKPTKVVNVYHNGLRECRKYVFNLHSSQSHKVELIATPDHKILMRKPVWCYKNSDTGANGVPFIAPLSTMKKSEWRAQATGLGDWEGTHEPRALFLGLMLGDGYMGSFERRSTAQLQFSCADQTLIDEITPYLEELGLRLRKGTGYSYYLATLDNYGGGKTSPIRDWLTELGLLGTRSHTKFIPDVVWSWDNASVAQLIGGLIATDGCVTIHKNKAPLLSFTSVSKQMVDTLVKLLAVRFGVHGTPPARTKAEDKQWANYDQWHFSVSYKECLEIVSKHIPIPGVKRERLANFLKECPENKVTRRPGYTLRYDDCEDVGLVDTYDLEVDNEDHLFLLANGLIVSNSTADGGYAAKRLANLAHRLVVTAHDSDKEHLYPRGVERDVNDDGTEGQLLAHEIGGYKRNTILTPKVLSDLHRQGIDKILSRSPAVGGPLDGGVYSRDLGVRELGGTLYPVGASAGLAASSSISEPMTQSIISCLYERTLVRMADGVDKEIRRIVAGDKVLGADKAGNTFPVKVNYVFDNGIQDCLRTEFSNGATVVSTGRHKFLSSGQEIRIDEMGDLPVTTVGRPTHVVSQEFVGPFRVYDMEVDHPDHLFVLSNTLTSVNSKHTGGVSGATGKQQGFPTLDRLISIPENFPGAAVHSRLDGKVDSVTPAPQGGWFVKIGDETHYADPDSAVTVKPGQEVEAGDPLTDGTVRPDEIVKHKGIGEGRLQFAKAFKLAAENAGFRPSTGNLELIARGLIDHVELHKELGDHVPGDIISYNTVEHVYEPRPGHVVDRPKKLQDHYLESPVLHYTIGTRITPSVAKNLEKWNIEKVHAHKEPPPFSPVMIRSQETTNFDPDWMTRFLGTGLEKSFLKGVHRGDVTDPLGTSYVPAVASGIGLGERGLTKGYDAKAFQASKNILPKQS